MQHVRFDSDTGAASELSFRTGVHLQTVLEKAVTTSFLALAGGGQWYVYGGGDGPGTGRPLAIVHSRPGSEQPVRYQAAPNNLRTRLDRLVEADADGSIHVFFQFALVEQG